MPQGITNHNTVEKERLVIKNFGPIKSVDLELGKMTILIGEQATGKSTIAKVLAVCRYFSFIVNYSVEIKKQNEFSNNEQFLQGLRNWEIDSYLTEDSSFIYKNSLYRFEFQYRKIIEFENISDGVDLKKEFFECHTKINSELPEFDKLLDQLDDLRIEETANTNTAIDFFQLLGWSPNENFYRLNVKKVMDNPLYIPTERNLDNALSVRIEALQDEVNKINNIVKRYKNETVISPLSITYKNQNGDGYVKKDNGSTYYPLHNGASGYQSSIPIVLAVKYYNEIENRQRTFIVEEPELNLFPTAQKKLVEFLVDSTGNHGNNKFLIPTHSPYIISSLNNLMVAYRVGQKNEKKTSDIVSKNFWIDPKHVKAYKLIYDENAEGIVEKDLILKDLQEISINDLDEVSKEINSVWDKLMQIEDES